MRKDYSMKCPACWTEKAYVRKVGGWKGLLLCCLFIVPLKCHHCYHKFNVSWFATLGKQITPPPRVSPGSRNVGLSYAARHYAATHDRDATPAKRGTHPSASSKVDAF